MIYDSVIWCICNKESLNRVLKLLKRAARVILSANHMASSVELFNELGTIDEYAIIFKHLQGKLPSYLSEHIIIIMLSVLNMYVNRKEVELL